MNEAKYFTYKNVDKGLAHMASHIHLLDWDVSGSNAFEWRPGREVLGIIKVALPIAGQANKYYLSVEENLEVVVTPSKESFLC